MSPSTPINTVLKVNVLNTGAHCTFESPVIFLLAWLVHICMCCILVYIFDDCCIWQFLQLSH